ncbi:VOC family protein [Liquorilactobacillus sucicola]|nr:VOC family protein [Liquorilactobacillus sucicola]
MDFKLCSLYLCVYDMERAVNFYEKLLEMKVYKFDTIYSIFVIDNFRMGLFAFEKVNETHILGTNCVPSLSVPDLKSLKNKLSYQKICFPLKQINKNWVAEIEDSEGNRIELTAPVKN